MSDTAVQPAHAVDQWLAGFDEALTAGDAAAAAAALPRGQLLARPRRVHLEHQDRRGPRRRRATCSSATLARRAAARLARRPSRRTRPTASIEAWIEFETAAGRGNGHLRLKDGKAWTLLTDDVRAQGPRGAARARPAARASSTAPTTDRETWLEARQHEAEELGYDDAALRRDRRRRPGRHRARRAAAAARRADDHRRAQRAARRLLAQALQVAVPARPGLVRPPAVHPVPRELAGVLAQGQDRRLARDVHEGDGAQLLGLDDRARAPATTRTPASGRSSSSATAPTSRCGRSSSCSPPACRASRTCRRSRAWTSSRATSTTPRSTRARTPTRGKRCVVIGSNNSAHDICAALWEARRRRDDGAALLDAHRALGHADGARPRRALLRGGGRGGHDHREGRPDLRLAARTGSCTSSRSRSTTRCASATRTSTTGSRRPASTLDFGDDGSGLFMKYLRRGSGYYIDVGASELVANGDDQARRRARSTSSPRTRWCWRTAPSCRPTSSSTPPATAR